MSTQRPWLWESTAGSEHLTPREIRKRHTAYGLAVIEKRLGQGLNSLETFQAEDRASVARQQAGRRRAAQTFKQSVKAGLRSAKAQREVGRTDIRPFPKG